MSAAGLLAAVGLGGGTTLLVWWAGTVRAATSLRRHARSQIGLASPVVSRAHHGGGPLHRRGGRRIPVGLLGSVRRRRRARELDDALAPLLGSVVDQLRVGRSLLSALESVGPATAEPLASIVRRLVTETRLGGSLADSLSTIAAEERNRHLEVIASAVALHTEQGGSLTDILVGVSDSIEDEDRLRRDMLTLTADARLSANVLLVMPIGALVITSLLSPGYATPLIATPVGRVLSLSGLLLGAIGVIWLRALARPEEL